MRGFVIRDFCDEIWRLIAISKISNDYIFDSMFLQYLIDYVLEENYIPS